MAEFHHLCGEGILHDNKILSVNSLTEEPVSKILCLASSVAEFHHLCDEDMGLNPSGKLNNKILVEIDEPNPKMWILLGTD